MHPTMPTRSVLLHPPTCSGLCDAVTMTPMAFPPCFLLRRPARSPTLKRTLSSLSALVVVDAT